MNLSIFYVDHQSLKYLVNKQVHQVNICQLFLLLQEFEFEVTVKLGKINHGQDQLSRLETGEHLTKIHEHDLLDANIFKIEATRS